MKQFRQLFLLVVLISAASLLIPASAQSFNDFAIDFRTNPYTVVGGGELPTGVTIEGAFNDAQHGYKNVIATIPVEAGDYRITLGTCQYGTGTGAVANADGTITFATFDQKATACYDADPATNIVSVVIAVPSEQSIVVDCGNYTPYLAIEKLADDQYTINFVNTTADVIGEVPAETTVVKNESLTLPINQSMYKEGYTLTGWTDGSNTYAPGATFTPTAHTTLTAVFTSNTISIPTATSSVSVRWYFGESNGAPSVHFEGGAGNGYLITQAIVDGVAIDAKLDIDATSGKFFNTGRNDQWAQVKATTTFAFLSKQGAIVSLGVYNDPVASTLDDKTYTSFTSNVGTYSADPVSDVSVFSVTDGEYYSYLELTYTAPAPPIVFNDFAIDFRTDPYTVVGGGELPTGVTIEGAFNDAQHGYKNVIATIPVEAGDYRITLGTCQYGTGTGAVANADGTITFATFDQKATACYDADPATNIVSVVIAVPSEQSIVVDCGNYTPYLAIEKLADDQYTINFVNTTADVIGEVPAETTVVKNESLTLPINQSMYKEGYTLTGWTDGSNTYAPGATFTPTAHTTLTAVFTSNTISIPTATSSVSVRWYFGESNGAPSVHFEGGAGNGYLITQAIVDGVAIDAKLDIDATSGKFFNTGRNDQWAQVKATTTFAFLSKQGAIVSLGVYNDPVASTLDDKTYTSFTSNVGTYSADPVSDVSVFSVTDGEYYSYLELLYTAPVPMVPSIGDGNSAEVVTFIAANNGQTFDELIIDRPVYNDMYNTLCLPFNMDALQIAASSLNGVEIREFAGASVVGEALYISVSELVNAIVAGRPYFIKYNAALSLENMTFEDVIINNADLESNKVGYNGVTMMGTFAPFLMNAQEEFETDGYVFLGQNNQLYWPNTTNAIKPFRAYFKINISGGGTMPIKRGMPVKISEPNNMPTEIEGVIVEENIGRKIIENGQLIIVRNGVYYNAEGQIVK